MEDPEPTASTDALDALRRIVEQTSIESWQDPDALRGQLAKRQVSASEVNLLVNALREGVPQRIRRERTDTPREVLLGILRSRLIEGQGMSPDRASWAARTWLDALIPHGPVIADDFVWGPHAPAATKESAAKKADPKPPPSSARFTIVAVVIACVSLFVVVRWLDTRGAPAPGEEYTVAAVDVFTSDVGSVGLQELLNMASSCMAGAAFGSERCRIILPVPAAIPFIGVDQTVTYMSVPSRTVNVPVVCTLTDPGGHTADTRELTGELPDLGFGQPTPGTTRWRTMFRRPESGWTPGLYRVECASPRTSTGWFEVRP